MKTVSFANIAGNPGDNLALAAALGLKVNTSDIYNALDQTAAGKVLDARQGKVLNDAISDIITLLWTNPNSTLAESDVVVGDLSAYRFIDIECYYTEANDATSIQRFSIGNGGILSILAFDTSGSALNCVNYTTRRFSWKNSTTIHFQSGNMVYTSSPYIGWDNRCVPRRIWGVK